MADQKTNPNEPAAEPNDNQAEAMEADAARQAEAGEAAAGDMATLAERTKLMEKAIDSMKLSDFKEALGEFYDANTKPNIAFVGRRINAGVKDVKPGEPGFVPREPLRKISDGMDTIKLPEDQSKPFYHKEASRIVAIAPELYKPVIDK